MTIRELSEDYLTIIKLGDEKRFEDTFSSYFMELVTIDSMNAFQEYMKLLESEDLLFDIFVSFISYMKVSLELYKRNKEEKDKQFYINVSSHLLFNLYKSKLKNGSNGYKFLEVNDIVSKITCKVIEDIIIKKVDPKAVFRCTLLQVFKIGANSTEHKTLDDVYFSPKSYLENEVIKNADKSINENINVYLKQQNSLYTDFSALLLENIKLTEENIYESYYVFYNMVLVLLLSYSDNIINIINKTPLFALARENSEIENNLQVK